MENIRQTAVHADGEGGIIIQTRQDVSDIVEQNKKNITRMTREQDGLIICLVIR